MYCSNFPTLILQVNFSSSNFLFEPKLDPEVAFLTWLNLITWKIDLCCNDVESGTTWSKIWNSFIFLIFIFWTIDQQRIIRFETTRINKFSHFRCQCMTSLRHCLHICHYLHNRSQQSLSTKWGKTTTMYGRMINMNIYFWTKLHSWGATTVIAVRSFL